MPPDVQEFIAGLLQERKTGRPSVPAKLKVLHSIARNPELYDAALDFGIQRANWRGSGRGNSLAKKCSKRLPNAGT
jgi:hypothetical protein